MVMSFAQPPIGIFDSGIGGLSILQALRTELPHEHFVYVADSAYAPYGERGDAFVAARTHAITDFLTTQHHIKALVVACNTATAAAIDEVRARYPALLTIGIEPALKPAVAASQTGRIGVMGTRGTLGSAKFGKLLSSLEGQAQFVLQPCDGLAHAIECSTESNNATKIIALCASYTRAMGTFGSKLGEIDTLVLGCTHYAFAQGALRDLLGPHVQLMAAAEPVARQTRRLLEKANALALAPTAAPLCPSPLPSTTSTTSTTLWTTGPLAPLQAAAARWLGLPAQCCDSLR